MSITSVYNIATLSYGEIDAHDKVINSILSGEISGVIIEDFLSAEETHSILENFRAIDTQQKIHINGGFDSYPMSFAQFDQMVRSGKLLEEDYFKVSKDFISQFYKNFGVDVIGRLKDFVYSSSNNIELDIPKNALGTGEYVPFTYRELFPGEGCLKAHCENLFYQEFPGFFETISRFSIQEQQLSFFLLLQEPGEGGELVLYDLLWENTEKRLSDIDVLLKNGEVISVEDTTKIARDTFSVKKGSLVVFSGGSIWHRVNTVTNAPSRITLGGFMSFSHDRTKLYCWS